MSTKGIQTPQLTVDGALNTLYEPGIATLAREGVSVA
nr:MAG TPA: hypothetical protein [Caudoviricetes sp.]